MKIKKIARSTAVHEAPARAMSSTSVAPAGGQYQGGNCLPHIAAVPVSMRLMLARMKPHEGAGGATSKSPQPASGSIFLEKPPHGYYHITDF